MLRAINGTTGINTQSRAHRVSFGYGKIRIYSDFDKTYCPYTQDKIREGAPELTDQFSKYSTSFDKFFKNTEENVIFNVTTSRTFGEFKAVSELIKDRGVRLPLPESLIVKNGSDSHYIITSSDEYYDGGEFPYRYNQTDEFRVRDLKRETGWDGETVKKGVKGVLAMHDFDIVSADSERSPREYGTGSLFSDGKLTYEHEQVFYGTDKPRWVAGLRNDGAGKVFITYPPDMLTCPERVDALKTIHKEFDEYLKYHNIKPALRTINTSNPVCGYRVCETIEPIVDQDLKITNAFTPSEQGLTKLYDTKKAVESARINNDLVVVAGDSINDYNMLNPINYIRATEGNSDYPELCKLKGDARAYAREIVTQPKKYKKVLKEFENLPLVSILVKKPHMDPVFEDLAKAFSDRSRLFNMIIVEAGELEKGIRQAIFEFAQKHPDFKAALSEETIAEVITPVLEAAKNAKPPKIIKGLLKV